MFANFPAMAVDRTMMMVRYYQEPLNFSFRLADHMSNPAQDPPNLVQLAVMAEATAMIAATRYCSLPLLPCRY
jgi:hypothetical protein